MATDPVTEPQPGPAAAHPWPRHSVRALFEARSVALVGASTRPGSVGATMVRQLRDGGYRGAILPVNPRHREIEGLPCVPSLDDLPHAVDLAVLAVPEASLEHEFTRAVDHGVSGAVIFGSPRDRRADSDAGAPPVAEPGDGGQGRAAGHAHAVRARMAEAAARTGMVVCGPNCMGFIDFPNRLRAVAYFEPFERRPGPVTFISHSGSVFSAMLHNRRAIEFDLAISAGEELTSTVADYIRHAVARETTRVIGLFLETVRDPRGFLHALALAAERDVPIVALTVGRTAVARRLVEAHSGAVAGDDAAFEAVFDRYGVLRVETLDELADSLELLAAGRRARPGGLAAVLDSGGERAHLLDVAASAGVRFAEPAPATTRRLEDALEPGLPAVNPLDAWGTMSLYEHVYRESIAALLDDPDTGALVLAVDITPEEDLALGYVPLLEEMAAGTDVPVAVLGHASTAIGPVQAAAGLARAVPAPRRAQPPGPSTS